MPLNRVPLSGNQIVAMANVSRQLKTNIPANAGPLDTQLEFSELNCLGLPSLMYWITLQTAVANVRWAPLFAVANISSGGAPVPNWEQFTNGAILVPNNTTVFTIRAAVALMGIRILVPPGIGITVTTVVTAGG